MTAWAEFEKEAPAFAATVRRRFDAGINKALATLRRDGSLAVGQADVGSAGSWFAESLLKRNQPAEALTPPGSTPRSRGSTP